MTLRNAATCMLVAFIVGAFAGYRFAVDQLTPQEVSVPPVITAGQAMPMTPATVTAPLPFVASADATNASIARKSVAPVPAPTTLPAPTRSFAPGPDPTLLSHAEFQAAVKRFFEEEGEDSAWRAATEAQLTDHFYRQNPLGVGSTLTTVECRASICRVEATSMEKDASNVMGPRSLRWGDLVAFYSQSHDAVAGGPTQFTLYLRPQAAFVAASPHP